VASDREQWEQECREAKIVGTAQRCEALAKAACMGVVAGKHPELRKHVDGYWFITKLVGGDLVLPNTRGCRTEREALTAAEDWFDWFPPAGGPDDRR